MDLKGIPVVTEYCCQIVVIKIIYILLRCRLHKSNIVRIICEPICSTTRRTFPLRISTCCWPFMCCRELSTPHTITLKRKLKLCRRVSTLFGVTVLSMGLPSGLSSETLENIFHSTKQICATANAKTSRKMSIRFGVPTDERLP
jgi:hypothetical protein